VSRWEQGSLFVFPDFVLAELDGSDFVTFLFVGWQLPASKLAVSVPITGVQPPPAFGATVDAMTTRDPVLLITPIIHESV